MPRASVSVPLEAIDSLEWEEPRRKRRPGPRALAAVPDSPAEARSRLAPSESPLGARGTAIYDVEDDQPYADLRPYGDHPPYADREPYGDLQPDGRLEYETVDQEGPYEEPEQESPFEDPTYVSPYGDLDWRIAGMENVTSLADHASGRRTVTIQGRGAERNLPLPRPRRPTPARHERAGFRPDRVAMWAVMLGLLLVFVAATSAHP